MRRNAVAVSCTLASILGCFFNLAVAQTTPRTKAEFLAIYEPAVERIAEVYRHSQMDVTFSRSKFRNQADVTVRFSIGASGDKLRFERNYLTGPESGKRRAAVASPIVSFGVEAGPDKPYQVAEMSSDLGEAMDFARMRCPVAFAPYVYFNGTIPQYLNFDVVDIKSIEEATVHGERRVAVTYGPPGPPPDPFENKGQQGRFVFLPDRSWALRGNVVIVGTEQDDVPDVKVDIEYGDDVDGVPIVKSYETYYEAPGRKVNIERYDVTKFVPKAPPDSDFTLPAFGLPDVAQSRPGFGRYTIVLVGVAVLILGLAVRFWLTRRP